MTTPATHPSVLTTSGAAVLLAVLGAKADSAALRWSGLPILIDRMIQAIQENPNRVQEDDEAILVLSGAQRYMGLLENVMKEE